MRIYNSLTKKKEELTLARPGKIKMFVCGPTVYDYIHIGNARTFVFFDAAAKYLRHKGYQVDYIQNITDIDDKIIQRAQESGQEPLALAKEFEQKFLDDMKALGVTAVSDYDRYARATDHIQEVKKQVKILIDKGNAYLIEGDGWYFDLKTFPDYGKLSGRTVEMAEDAISRIDENPDKRNRGDFVLWKFSEPGEPSWPAPELADRPGRPAGAGRPGWHIEDTATTEKYFGPQYDIHGGGQDLMFPHHEAEIAQQESASGLKPFVRYWMHVGFLINKSKKMSKSQGNFLTLNEALKKYSPQVLRFYFLSAHYRSSLDFSEKIINQAEAAVQRIAEFILKLQNSSSGIVPFPAYAGNGTMKKELENYLQDLKAGYENTMDDDFNTPSALAVIFEFIKKVNPLLSAGRLPAEFCKDSINILMKLNKVLGIIGAKTPELPAEIRNLVDERELVREQREFEKADDLRRQILSLGYQIDDTAYGPLIKKK